MKCTFLLVFLSSLFLLKIVVALVPLLSAQTQSAPSALSRRYFLSATAAAVLGSTGWLIHSPASLAVASSAVPSEADLQRIKTGFAQINHLLDNFDAETTVCNPECKRNADAIRQVLGLRSTKDPLFQIEKVFEKVKNMDLDPDKLEAFFDATEDWNSSITMSNSMAFISQFGEYNPGGGQDNVLKYLNESKKQVILAQKSLKTIMECLDLKPELSS